MDFFNEKFNHPPGTEMRQDASLIMPAPSSFRGSPPSFDAVAALLPRCFDPRRFRQFRARANARLGPPTRVGSPRWSWGTGHGEVPPFSRESLISARRKIFRFFFLKLFVSPFSLFPEVTVYPRKRKTKKVNKVTQKAAKYIDNNRTRNQRIRKK